MENLIPQNPGGVKDRYDNRDYKYDELIAGAASIIDWEKGYSVEQELNTQLKIESQGSSSSCVGQAWSKYAEVLNHFEEKQFVDLSASFIYSQIYLPQGGAYIRDGAKLLVKQGDSTEEILSSYTVVGLSDGRKHYNAMTEDEYRAQGGKITDEIRENAKVYQSLSYALVAPSNIDLIADAIHRNHGAVTGARGTNEGWSSADIRPPLPGELEWGHGIYLCGYGMNDKGKYIEFPNSWSENWGDNGKGRFYEDYVNSNDLFAIWTLIDKKNITLNDMIETIKLADKPEIYAKSKTDNKLYWVGGWESYQQLLQAGWISEVKVVENLDGLEPVWQPFGFLK